MEAADEAADLFLCGGGRAPFPGAAGVRHQIAAGAEGTEQERGEALEIGGSGGGWFRRMRDGLGIACEFVEGHSYSLAEVHGAMLFPRGDAQEPMAVAEVFIRKTALLRTEQKGDRAGRKPFANEESGLIEPPDGVLQLTETDGRSSNDQRAVRNSFGEGLTLFGAGEQRRGANRRARLAECQFVSVYHTKMEKAEVAHRAGGGADVERIARTYEYDAQAVEFGMGRQGRRVYSRRQVMKQKR